MSARSFSDILRMEAAMDLALIIDLAERPPFAATELACLNLLLLLINCCLTSWTSKSISLARAWRGRRRRNKKRRGWWNRYRKKKTKKTRGILCLAMNKWNWSSMRQRGLVHYGAILSLTHSDSLRFRLQLPCRNVDLRVCCSVDWKLREHSFDTKRTPSLAKISMDRESCIRERKTQGNRKIQTFIYLFAFWESRSSTGQHNTVNN